MKLKIIGFMLAMTFVLSASNSSAQGSIPFGVIANEFTAGLPPSVWYYGCVLYNGSATFITPPYVNFDHYCYIYEPANGGNISKTGIQFINDSVAYWESNPQNKYPDYYDGSDSWVWNGPRHRKVSVHPIVGYDPTGERHIFAEMCTHVQFWYENLQAAVFNLENLPTCEWNRNGVF